MKKFKYLIFCALFSFLIPLVGCKGSDPNKITIAEVTHSLFYAPMYVAKEKGFFKDEGLDVTIITTPGADKVMAALISKEADIGLMGPEASVYNYVNGNKDYAINFAQLTQKDGSFLLGREKIDNFTLSHLKGSTIIGGRKGGMPEMTLEYILKKASLSISQDVNNKDVDVRVRTDVSFDAVTGVFVAGESDYATAFEPVGTQIEKANKGYIIASLGKLLNENVPYTCFSSLKSTLEKRSDQIQRFTNAIIKGLDYVVTSEIKDIIPYLKTDFSSSSDEELTKVMNNYLEIEAWPKTMSLTKESFEKLIDIVKEAGELDQEVQVPYDSIVTTDFIVK